MPINLSPWQKVAHPSPLAQERGAGGC